METPPCQLTDFQGQLQCPQSIPQDHIPPHTGLTCRYQKWQFDCPCANIQPWRQSTTTWSPWRIHSFGGSQQQCYIKPRNQTGQQTLHQYREAVWQDFPNAQWGNGIRTFTRSASAASWIASMAVLCILISFMKEWHSKIISFAILRTSLWNGAFLMSKSIAFWYLQIACSATVPGRHWCFILITTVASFATAACVPFVVLCGFLCAWHV